MKEGEQGPFVLKLRVRIIIKDNNSSLHGKFHQFLFPFSSKFPDQVFTSYVLYIFPCGTRIEPGLPVVWIRVTYPSDKISASSLVATCVRICDKSLQQNLNQPMREHQLVSRAVKFELVYISSLSKLIACTEQVSYRRDLSQHQCRRGELSPRCVAAICRIVCLGLYFAWQFQKHRLRSAGCRQ